MGVRGGRQWLRLGCWVRVWRCCSRVADPDQHLPGLVNGQTLGLEEFILQGLQGLIVQRELQLERTVRYPAATSEEIHNLVEHVVKIHHPPPPTQTV